MDPEFTWPQVWTTDLAVDQALPGGFLGTLEMVYGRDMNGIFMRNADLRDAVAFLGDARPFYNNCPLPTRPSAATSARPAARS
jgi:hypothetical protein